MYLYWNINAQKIVKIYTFTLYVINARFINFSSFGNVLGIKIIEIHKLLYIYLQYSSKQKIVFITHHQISCIDHFPHILHTYNNMVKGPYNTKIIFFFCLLLLLRICINKNVNKSFHGDSFYSYSVLKITRDVILRGLGQNSETIYRKCENRELIIA